MTETDFEKWLRDNRGFGSDGYYFTKDSDDGTEIEIKALKDAGFNVQSQREKDNEAMELIQYVIEKYDGFDEVMDSYFFILREWKSKRGDGNES